MPYVSGFDRDQLMCCSWDAFVDKESIARIIDAFVNHLDIGKYGVKPVAAEAVHLTILRAFIRYIFTEAGKVSVLHGNWLKAVK